MDSLCEACANLKWVIPTPIQREALPVAFEGRENKCIFTFFQYALQEKILLG